MKVERHFVILKCFFGNLDKEKCSLAKRITNVPDSNVKFEIIAFNVSKLVLTFVLNLAVVSHLRSIHKVSVRVAFIDDRMSNSLPSSEIKLAI